ncbi:MAG: toll/interleukin-1 receptor domain-containing protein [Leptolyngbya sp. SIO1E4]|nr:toll/interleukin-1 receptor domain-containing protein [Leptolyngbya sp. SIO1E4]
MSDSLSPTERRTLLQTLSRLPPATFETIVFNLNPPSGILPGRQAPQTSRAVSLLEWADGPTGCGLRTVLNLLATYEPATIEVPAVEIQKTGTQAIRIFLAHAKEDKDVVIGLYDRLKQQGYQPWLDEKDLLPGQNWRDEIPKAIRESDIFIACLSKLSVAKQSYVQREFRMALNELADKPPGTIYLIPLRLDDCQIPELRQNEYGINFQDYHWLDYFEPDGFERLVKAIEHQFG